MLKVVGTEVARDETDGRSLLDEIAREGARRMLVAALESEVAYPRAVKIKMSRCPRNHPRRRRNRAK